MTGPAITDEMVEAAARAIMAQEDEFSQEALDEHLRTHRKPYPVTVRAWDEGARPAGAIVITEFGRQCFRRKARAALEAAEALRGE